MAKPAAARSHFHKLFLASCFLLLASVFAGCAPSYSPLKAADSVVEILQKEYQIDAYAKLNGSMLGVRYPVDHLIDSRLNLVPETLDEMQHVVLSLHRVGLSSGKEIQFYTLVVQDPVSAAELILVGSYLDIKRVRLLDISRNEYFKRIIRDLRFNPEILAENSVRNLFSDLSIKKAELALEEYYSKKVTSEEITTLLFPTLLLALPDTTEFQIQQLETKRISETKALLLCRTREFYASQPAFQYLTSVFPQGFQNEYLFVVDSNLYPRSIERIVPKYMVDEQNRIREQPIRQIFNEYPNIIAENDRFYLKEYTLAQFLAELIEHRIRDDVQKDDQLSKTINLRSVQGTFDTDKKGFTFSLIAIPAGREEKLEKTEGPSQVKLFETSLMTTAEVLKGYWFKDYDSVNFVDVLNGATFSIQRDGVDQFRLKKIGINELLHQSSYLSTLNP